MLTKSELKAWVADLRAHPELQGQEYLKTKEGKFCCLGRLCEVQGIPWDGATSSYSFSVINCAGNVFSCSALIGDLAEEFGSNLGDFSSLNMPNLIHEGHSHAVLANANDLGVPFSAIADHLEKYYPAVEDPA
jgi:hypothetical protein